MIENEQNFQEDGSSSFYLNSCLGISSSTPTASIEEFKYGEAGNGKASGPT